MVLLRKELNIRFGECLSDCHVDFEGTNESDDEINNNARSRSRSKSQETKEKTIKKENQIWAMGNLSKADQERMKKLMGVKAVNCLFVFNLIFFLG